MTKFAMCLLAATALHSVANAQPMFGVGGFQPFTAQTLHQVNPATGATTAIGSTGLAEIAGLSFDASTSRLMALTVAGDIYSINPATGAATVSVIGTTTVPEGALAFRSGIAYTTIFDDLHVLAGNSWVSVGASGASSFDISGLTFGAGGTLFGVASNGSNADTLLSFNTTTGAATVLSTLSGVNVRSIGDLAYDNLGGLLYLTDGVGLYTIDTASGAATLVGAHTATGFSGLAIIPTPASGLMMLVGVIAIGRRRR